MNAYMSAFIQYVKDHPLKYADVDVDSLLEMFYWCYAEEYLKDSEKAKACLREIRGQMEPLEPENAEILFARICDLCMEKERTAFLEGFRAGGQWALELSW